MSSKDRSDSEFQLVPLADDAEYRVAQAAVADAEKAMVDAEQRYGEATGPAAERAWKEVKRTRAALADRVAEVRSARSLAACQSAKPEYDAVLRTLVDALESVSRAVGGLAGIEARITSAGLDCGSDVIGVALPGAREAPQARRRTAQEVSARDALTEAVQAWR